MSLPLFRIALAAAGLALTTGIAGAAEVPSLGLTVPLGAHARVIVTDLHTSPGLPSITGRFTAASTGRTLSSGLRGGTYSPLTARPLAASVQRSASLPGYRSIAQPLTARPLAASVTRVAALQTPALGTAFVPFVLPDLTTHNDDGTVR